MQLNSQFNAQFPDVEETMNKPMDDEKIRDAALEAGLDYESRDTLYRFATILTDPLKAELERQTALVQQQAKVIAGLLPRITRRMHSGICDCSSCVGDRKALAAAAPFLPQTKDEKEK